MLRRGRPPIYLRTAALAGCGGILSIGYSAGIPLWDALHGHARLPVLSLFSLWGGVALVGAAAKLYLYSLAAPPSRPPRGGNRLAQVASIDARRRPPLGEELRKAA
jgi:hypothetical protein